MSRGKGQQLEKWVLLQLIRPVLPPFSVHLPIFSNFAKYPSDEVYFSSLIKGSSLHTRARENLN